MKKTLRHCGIALVALGYIFCTGCMGTAPVMGPKSPIMADWKAPLNTNLKDVQLGSKTGRATNKTYAFGLISTGDMSVATAARDGDIKTIRHVDYEYKNVFFFAYQEITTIVYGD